MLYIYLIFIKHQLYSEPIKQLLLEPFLSNLNSQAEQKAEESVAEDDDLKQYDQGDITVIKALHSQRKISSLYVVDEQQSGGRRKSEGINAVKNKNKLPQVIAPIYHEVYNNFISSFNENDQEIINRTLGMDWKGENDGKNNLFQYHSGIFITAKTKIIGGRNPDEFTVMYIICTCYI